MNNGKIPKVLQTVFIATLIFPIRILKIYSKYVKECNCDDIELSRILMDAIVHSALYSILFFISRILISIFVGELFGDIIACQVAILMESYISPKIYKALYGNNYCHGCMHTPSIQKN